MEIEPYLEEYLPLIIRQKWMNFSGIKSNINSAIDNLTLPLLPQTRRYSIYETKSPQIIELTEYKSASFEQYSIPESVGQKIHNNFDKEIDIEFPTLKQNINGT